VLRGGASRVPQIATGQIVALVRHAQGARGQRLAVRINSGTRFLGESFCSCLKVWSPL
jgi:hypothetical protein